MSLSIEVNEALENVLLEKIQSSKGRVCVIHAGHFALDSDCTRPREDLLDSEQRVGVPSEFIEFSRLTWSLACRLLRRARLAGHKVFVMVLVNDWQFIVDPEMARRAAERLGDARRRQYYSAVRQLPRYHSSRMGEYDLGEDVVFKAAPERWMFSESELRSQLPKTIKELEAQGLAGERGLKTTFTEHGEPIISVDRSELSELGGELRLLYCGTTGCSGEVVQLLKILHDRDVGVFVNLYPSACVGPVTAGTEVARQTFLLRGMKVHNVAVSIVETGRAIAEIDSYNFI